VIETKAELCRIGGVSKQFRNRGFQSNAVTTVVVVGLVARRVPARFVADVVETFQWSDFSDFYEKHDQAMGRESANRWPCLSRASSPETARGSAKDTHDHCRTKALREQPHPATSRRVLDAECALPEQAGNDRLPLTQNHRDQTTGQPLISPQRIATASRFPSRCLSAASCLFW